MLVSLGSEDPLANRNGVYEFSLGKLMLVTMFKAYRVDIQSRLFYLALLVY